MLYNMIPDQIRVPAMSFEFFYFSCSKCLFAENKTFGLYFNCDKRETNDTKYVFVSLENSMQINKAKHKIIATN